MHLVSYLSFNSLDKIRKLGPFGKTKCYREDVDFNTCLLCQLYWIRGLLYRFVLDFEASAKLTVVDMIEKILKRSRTDKERKLIEDIHKERKNTNRNTRKLKKKIAKKK